MNDVEGSKEPWDGSRLCEARWSFAIRTKVLSGGGKEVFGNSCACNVRERSWTPKSLRLAEQANVNESQTHFEISGRTMNGKRLLILFLRCYYCRTLDQPGRAELSTGAEVCII